MHRRVKFRIVLETPPAGVAFGLQQGRGSSYETIETQVSEGKDLVFDFNVEVTATAAPDFRGPLVQGPRAERFVYIDIGQLAGQTASPWTRRLKVPFRDLMPATIERAIEDDRVLETRVPGTAKDGTPTCATVKPFDGWTLAP
jgi:hypothetical protein